MLRNLYYLKIINTTEIPKLVHYTAVNIIYRYFNEVFELRTHYISTRDFDFRNILLLIFGIKIHKFIVPHNSKFKFHRNIFKICDLATINFHVQLLKAK